MIRSEARLSRRPWFKDRDTLKGVNERLLKDDLTLHPTKGFRKVNPKLSLASTIVQMVKAGKMKYDTAEIREAFKVVEKFDG